MSVPGTSRMIAPAFEHATVANAMRAGIISCHPDTSLSAIAEMMASYHVHAVSSVELPSTNVFFKGQGPYDLTAVNGYVVGGRVHAGGRERVQHHLE